MMVARLLHASDAYTPEQIARFKADREWRDELLDDFLKESVEARPDAVAIVDETRSITWSELDQQVDRIAAGLVELGLQQGEFVAVQIPNIVEFVEVYLAIFRAGLRALTIMPTYGERDVAYMLEVCDVRAMVLVSEFRGRDLSLMAKRLQDTLPSLKHVILVGGEMEGAVGLERLRSTEPHDGLRESRRPDPDSVSRVSFTSGTTGRPKGVVHTHNADMTTPRWTFTALGLGAETTIWMPSPISHATGILFGLYLSVMYGSKLVLQDRWDAENALRLIQDHQAAFTVSATPFIKGILDCPKLADYDVSSFKYFVSGGAPIPSELVERSESMLGVKLLRVFGQSEAPLHTLNLPDDPWEKLVTTDGQLIGACKVKIVSEDRTRELPRGEVGEYATQGPHVFLGYFGEEEITAGCRTPDGWYFSGDLCKMDEDGHVIYVDRLKDIINRGGVKIGSMEIEEVVAAHPLVQRCAVVPIPDDVLVERACAVVVLEPGATLTLKELSEFLQGLGVTKHKWPERLVTVDEFPMTLTGKIQKNLLLEIALSAG
jgi:non-ribosomal peptide synthetase component E (peptide arylation enzyme)